MQETSLICLPTMEIPKFYHQGTTLLPRNLELHVLTPAGRHFRLDEPLITTFDNAIEDLFIQIEQLIDKPYIFFGHSIGGLLVYELTHYLLKKQLRLPTHLFISGCIAPQHIQINEPISGFPDELFLETMKAYYEDFPSELFENKEARQLFLPWVKADCSLFETYQYVAKPTLSMPIIAINGSNDKTQTANQMALWQSHTQNYYRQTKIPGNQFTMFNKLEKIISIIINEID